MANKDSKPAPPPPRDTSSPPGGIPVKDGSQKPVRVIAEDARPKKN